jgi:hypothetical protein
VGGREDGRKGQDSKSLIKCSNLRPLENQAIVPPTSLWCFLKHYQDSFIHPVLMIRANTHSWHQVFVCLERDLEGCSMLFISVWMHNWICISHVMDFRAEPCNWCLSYILQHPPMGAPTLTFPQDWSKVS